MNKINGKDFIRFITSGANALINSKNKIDALNVFPVPDGDTGTNMASTIEYAIQNIDKNENDISKAASDLAKKMLFGARGNSGVILSQIFRGFSQALGEKIEAFPKDLVLAFEGAYKKAYGAVLKPIEGTMLTVIRETFEGLEREIKVNRDVNIEDFFKKLKEVSRKSCDETPNKLKILREVGVTDSGGEGLFTVFEGMYLASIGQDVTLNANGSDEATLFISDTEVYDGEFGYCTEFIIELNDEKKFNKEAFTKVIQEFANSLVVVQDEKIVKVHGHVLKPGDLLNEAQKHGEFLKIKSENMTLQANNSKATAVEAQVADSEDEKPAECGIVSCNLGSGIIERMHELGCDYVIEGGQTQNPSAQDILDAIANVNAKTVFILPNNSNIMLVSQQAAQVVNDKNVIVVPTKTQVQGLAAILNFNKENSEEDNLEMMTEAIEDVLSGEVTQAVRTTSINGVNIKEGDFITIHKGKITSSNKTPYQAATSLITQMLDNPEREWELLTIYYGDLSSEADAIELESWVQNKFDIDVEIVNGAQPNYHFLIGVE
ncbi:DAK2 domain-containing protein [Mycoplasma sp. Ms02]|uniref:DAK2 domain-containing protein n=1 Tax=Mycoplasma sp. Ms02 TaxID=353851 RepID=UPI001C8AD43C|nr:DAK2 domain-containing protein [Mycoplasma sp. Ms02]QZE12293.1 DAK2 domain-containing protein [Mycoplasma sp. Ms02]